MPKHNRSSRNPVQGYIKDGIGYLLLTKGQVTLVDPEDVKWLSQWNWIASKNTHGYMVYRNVKQPDGRYRLLGLHILLAAPPHGMQVDHRNRDTLDNRRANLRICTQRQNNFNRRQQGGSSRFKGVSWDKRMHKWVASITYGTTHWLGGYENEEDAAVAYDVAAQLFQGEFACLNFPLPVLCPKCKLSQKVSSLPSL